MKPAVALSATLLFWTLAARAAEAPPVLPAYVPQVYAEAFAAWLRSHPAYRLATDEDCGCADDIVRATSERSELPASDRPFHPYYKQGDFNRDGVADAAFGVIDRAAPGQFSVLILDGAAWTKHHRIKAWLGAPSRLGEAMFYGPPANPEGGLMVGVFESEGCGIVKRWLGGYRLSCIEY